MSRPLFLPKLAGETLTETFDFTSDLAAGETLSTTAVTAAVYSGTDASPALIISGSATISGPVVSQNIAGGVAGVLYQLVCTAVTSLGQTLLQQAYLAVEAGLP